MQAYVAHNVRFRQFDWNHIMKLQLISAAIVAYTILAMAWIYYSGVGVQP